jgi:tetratricopeptide (TPR) repeat protein
MNRAMDLKEKGDFTRALDDYAKAIEIEPGNAKAYYGRGGLYNDHLKEYDKALDDYNKAIEIDPKYTLAYNNLAWLLAMCPDSEIRDPTRAVQLAQKAVQLDSKNGGHWNTLGVAQYRAGNWPEAIDALQKSNQILKGSHYSFNAFFLAMAHRQLGNQEKAQQFYQQAVTWMQKNMQDNEELIRFRKETEKLLSLPVVAQKPGDQESQ